MIVLESKRVCFVHIPKTAGSSLTVLLRPHILVKHRKESVSLAGHAWQRTWHVNEQHDGLSESLTCLEDPASYSFITVVRDPFEWIGSIWYSTREEELPSRPYRSKFQQFDQFLKVQLKERTIIAGKKTQSDFLRNDQGITVKVYKFEEDPVRQICNDLEIDHDPEVHRLKRPRDKEKVYGYNEEMREIVREAFSEDFIRFGY